MSASAPAPSSRATGIASTASRAGAWTVPVLLAISFLGAVGLQLVSARSQVREIELLRLENRLLDQEIRLLSQQLEAERILAAARERLLADSAGSDLHKAAASSPASPAESAEPTNSRP